MSHAFDYEASTVANWISGGAQGRQVLNAPWSGGTVLQSGAASATSGTGVRVVLQGNGSGGYHILTGFPTPGVLILLQIFLADTFMRIGL